MSAHRRVKVLATGDLHLGRRSTRMGGEGTDATSHPTSAVWEALVGCALAERVDAVVFTGDVIDRENRFYEAFGTLERGVRRLAEAGVPVAAVAGNHDFDVLPRLAEQLPAAAFRLVGEGGRWQRIHLPVGGEPLLAVDGWSFPAEHVTEDPLASYDLPAEERLPAVGLLHADVAQVTSRYAPVPLARLQGLPLAAWLLGHVHAPRLVAEGVPTVLYPGSPQAMDAREEGVHGPWLLTLEGRRVAGLEQVPLSPLRYQRLQLDLGGVATREDLDARVLPAVRGALEAAVAEGRGHLRALVCHLLLAGRTPLHSQLDEIGRTLVQLSRSHEGAVAVVDRVTVTAGPEADLEELARGAHPAGALARELLALAGDGRPELLETVQQRLAAVHAAAAFDGVRDDPPPSPEEVRGILQAAGYRLLDALLEQRRP